MSNSTIVNAAGHVLREQDLAPRDLVKSAPLSQADRHIRCYVGPQGGPLHEALHAQNLDVDEAVCSDTPLQVKVLCVSTQPDLTSYMLVGQPIEVQVLNDRGQWRSFMGIIAKAAPGQSDGALYTWLIEAIDALSLLAAGSNSRVFLGLNVVDITTTVLNECRQRSPALARAFEFSTTGLDMRRYPARQFTMQWNESPAAFLIRLWRKHGLSWVVRPGPAHPPAHQADGAHGGTHNQEGQTPCHTLVLFDDGMALPACSSGAVRYHHDGLTLGRNAVTLWSPALSAVPGRISAASWDYKAQRPTEYEAPMSAQLSANLGQAGQELAQAILDHRVEAPHWADNAADFDHLGDLRVQRQALEAAQTHGASGVRDLGAGQWLPIHGLPGINDLEPQETEHIVLSVSHFAQNNLPKTLDERATGLFAASGWQGKRPLVGVDDDNRRYGNTFTVVARSTPIAPAFDPAVHWPVMRAMSAIVVGPTNQEVHCDEWGRIKIRIPGLRMIDHQHAQGAGTSGSDRDSAWVRQATGWASSGFGALSLPRVGDEVVLDWLGGDPDKPLVTGSVYSPVNAPPRFENQGTLPGNKYLSGEVGKEVFGQRTSTALMDCTPDQIGLRHSTDHQATQHNLGYLVAPRQDGAGRPRGEGIESRTDAAAALRAAQGILLSAWARLQAAGNQLDYQEALALMEQGLALFKSMSQYAAEHFGMALDDGPQAELHALAKAWQAGTNTQPEAAQQDTAIIAITAPQGIAHNTPKGMSSFAGQNIDTVAQQHIQQVAGQHYTVNAGQGISQFAHAGGIRQIAHQGDYTVQSQHGNTLVDSAQNITIRAVGDITMMGQTITAVAHDGSFLKIGGGITQGTNGSISLHSSSYGHSGPQTMGSSQPEFSKGQPDGQFVLRFGDHTDPGSLIAPNKPYEIKLSDGSVIQGVSDSLGKTNLSLRDAMHIAGVTIGKA